MQQEKQTPSQGKRKLVLASSDSNQEEQLERRSKKEKKEEGRGKEKKENPQPVKKTTSSCKQVFTRRNKGMAIKDFLVEKDLATQLAQANQVIASQRQKITFLSQKAHQDAIAITTEEIPIHLSFAEKKKKIVVEKERSVKIK